MKRDFLSVEDLHMAEIERILKDAAELKKSPEQRLPGKVMAMIFEKPSTMTRISFEVGMHRLGGTSLYLSPEDLQIGRGETIADTARVLSRYVDFIMARVFSHDTLLEMAKHSTVPVINGLSDKHHPCQALADIMTIRESFGKLEGINVSFIGDGNNNVTHSLMMACAKVGANITVACPKGYEPLEEIVSVAKKSAGTSGSKITVTSDPAAAVRDADVIYSDVFVSIGHEDEEKKRLADLAPYQVNEALMAKAPKTCIFMHCLPAHRGQEVTDGVIDGPNSVVWRQAENRMHAQEALLVFLDEQMKR